MSNAEEIVSPSSRSIKELSVSSDVVKIQPTHHLARDVLIIPPDEEVKEGLKGMKEETSGGPIINNTEATALTNKLSDDDVIGLLEKDSFKFEESERIVVSPELDETYHSVNVEIVAVGQCAVNTEAEDNADSPTHLAPLLHYQKCSSKNTMAEEEQELQIMYESYANKEIGTSILSQQKSETMKHL